MPSASDIDIISTHEHSDGSLLFRFGDPSEIRKNVEMEESKSVKKEKQGEDKNESSVVKVGEGDDETEVMDAIDSADLIVSSSTTVISVEGESELSEKLLELTSNEEMGGISTLDLKIERIENVKGLNEEFKDSNPLGASILDESLRTENVVTAVEVSYEESREDTSNVASMTKETERTSISGVDVGEQTVNVNECLNQEEMDSPKYASIQDQRSKVVDNISTVALSDKESDDITSVDFKADQTGKVEECLNQEDEDSRVDESMLDQSSEVVDNISTVALSEKESDDIASNNIEVYQTGKAEECLNQEDEDSPADESMIDQSFEVVDKESDDVTFADIEADQTGKVEECLNQEDEDSLADESMSDQSSDVVNNISIAALLEKESDDIASAEIESNHTGKVKEAPNGDYEDSPVDDALVDKSSEVVNQISVVALLEKETDGIASYSDIEIEPIENVEEGINEEYEDSPVDTSVLDKRSEVLNNITTAASSEKETADITSAPGIDIEYTVNVEQGLDEVREEPSSVEQGLDEVREKPSAVEQGLNEVHEEPSALEQGLDEVHEKQSSVEQGPDEVHEEPRAVEQVLDEVHEEPSAVDASRPDKSPDVDNNITAKDFPGKETADATTLVVLKTNPVVAMLDTDAYQGSLESAATTNVALISEDQNVETVIQDEPIGDGRETLDDNLVSPSPQLEPEPPMSLYKETEEPNFQNLASEESSETDLNNVMALEVQNVLGNDNGSDVYGAEAESPTTGPAITWSIGSEEQASGSWSAVPNETVGYVSENDMTVPPQLEADSMLEEETATVTVEEPREDDTSENQTVGGDLVEASVHEVISPESSESTITSQEMLLTDFVLSSGAALLPHPAKVLTGGEDACFIAGRTWLGVADGVSQWSLEGTIPGVYAQELINNCEKLISDCNGNSINNPIELLNLSIAQTQSAGSSTVLIAQFDGQALHVANVGDSGFIVLRHGAVYKRSSPMHHAFSLPVHIERGDDPSSLAQFYRVDLEEEDVIVTATDGLLDNLYDQEVLLITMKSLAENKSLEEIAELLAKKAQEVGSSASARSPFADDAQAVGFPGYSGGKLDDVAVIVSAVRRR
ncbi:Protein phosphatase 2C family protein [Perilla frutescens var. frutescens]|nr:Protein phosphatase 2C family protein [Perilla frutescens var. frutescens]